MSLPRYHVLSSEDEVPVAGTAAVPLTMIDPPSWTTASYDKPPASEPLPTYNDVERIKLIEDEAVVQVALINEPMTVNGVLLGDDLAFVMTFLVSFLFGFIGYLVAFCLACSVAARTGSLAGFGAYVVNMGIVILLHFHKAGRGAMEDNQGHVLHVGAWVVYVFIALGGLVCLRGIQLYFVAKRAAGRERQAAVTA